MLAAASARPMHPGQDHSAARDRQASPLTQPPVMSGRHPLRTWRDFLGEFRACGLGISTIFPDEELEGSEVRGRGRRPGALALLHDLMVCGTVSTAIGKSGWVVLFFPGWRPRVLPAGGG